MANIPVSSYENNEPLAGTDLAEVVQPLSGGARREKKASLTTLKTFYQGTLATDVPAIIAGTQALDAISLSSGRIAFQELTSGTLSVSGWYTIAELDIGSFETGMATFSFGFYGLGRMSALKAEVGFSSSNLQKDFNNVTCKIISYSNIHTDRNQGILSVRIAKSDSVITSGAKVQIYLDINTDGFLVSQLVDNIGSFVGSQREGFTLVPPYLDNTPTLPDGVTSATFLEAGAELALGASSAGFRVNDCAVMCSKYSNDVVVCSVQWPEIPKQGTGITITEPSTQFVIVGNGDAAILSSDYTISDFAIEPNNRVIFRINKVGGFSSLVTDTPLVFGLTGTGGKLTITG